MYNTRIEIITKLHDLVGKTSAYKQLELLII